MDIRAYLIDEEHDRHYPLVDGENTIGRHGSNSVQILDITASRYHAVIEIHGDSFEYMDWQATHASIINDCLLGSEERHPLQSGDQIRIGRTTLHFKIEE